MGSQWMQFNRLWKNAWHVLSSPRLAACLLLALALCAALGSLFPQQPPRPDPSAWTAMIQQRYGARVPLYTSLGLFHIYDTPLFVALGGALAVSTLACTMRRALRLFQANALRQASRWPSRAVQPDALYQAASVQARVICHARPVGLSAAQRVEAGLSVLSHHHYHARAARRGDIDYLYGERHGWARWATLVTHGAAALLIVSLLLRQSLAWRDTRVQLVPGQVHAVGHNTPWVLRFDRFSGRAWADGRSAEVEAHLSLLAPGRPPIKRWLGPNSPLRHRGLRVHLFSWGPAVRVRAESKGNPVGLKILGEEEAEGEEEMLLALPGGGRNQALLVPSHDLGLRFSPQIDAGGLDIEATQGQEQRLVWKGPVSADGRVKVGDLLVQVRRDAFVVVDIAHDPSFLPVIVSAALMVGGLSCTFAFPTRQIWVKVAPGEAWVAGRASHDPLGLERHFQRLAQEIQLRISGAGRDVDDG
jgi:cytochrome c biogenesis protein